MYQKLLWTLGGFGVLVAGVLLWRVMPDQAWVVRDAQGDWQLAARGSALLWRGWPLVLTGVALGFVIALGVFFPGLRCARERDLLREIVKARRQRDQATAVAMQQVSDREARAAQREVAAIAAQEAAEQAQQEAKLAAQEADAMWVSAEDFQELAGERINEANFRLRNAIRAAERIKRQARRRLQPRV